LLQIIQPQRSRRRAEEEIYYPSSAYLRDLCG
jgi:hypothetical protein